MEQYILNMACSNIFTSSELGDFLLYMFAQLNAEFRCVLCLPLFGGPAFYLT